MEDDYLLISGIQHFCFCRRQWALIHIENAWDENALTAEGRILHDRVHDSGIATSRSGTCTFRALPVQSSRLRITGECDAVEFVPDKDGIPINGRPGMWKVQPVEYKKGHPKVSDCDRLQLAAQCVCLEEMLGCKIDKAFLYYFETRHRQSVDIDDALRTKLENMISEMRGYFERCYTPKVHMTKSCQRCSLPNVCVPELQDRRAGDSVANYISMHLKDE